jgi:NAD(P)-dependent dehydrogenase (short-subunit alcohol dehydrogenase family)
MARFYLNGKVALVTGAARGIGFATARALVARGAFVTVVDLDKQAAELAASQIHPTNALGLAVDVTDRGALQRAIAATVERLGGLDVVVANAGIARRAATLRTTPSESFERVLDVNLFGVYRTVESALPQIVSRQGHIVVISSIYAFANGGGALPYAMSKAAVEQLGRSLRLELIQHGASVTVAYFGFIDTEMVRRAIDHDPLAERVWATFPPPLRKRLPPSVAGEAIVHAIERRRPRVIRPRRWTVLSVLRGVVNPLLDAQGERDQTVQSLMREIDSRPPDAQQTAG